MRAYTTVTEAISDLKRRGYIIDFNLGFNGVHSYTSGISLAADKFEITEVYRFEGNTDPNDEAVIYAIKSHDGQKGLLSMDMVCRADPIHDEMVKKLVIRH